MEFGHRPRSNTAQRLEKMEMERKKAAKMKHIKWEPKPVNITEDEKLEMFKRKDLSKQDEADIPKRQSLLSEQLVKSPLLPRNPFTEYMKCDGNVRKSELSIC